MGQEIRWSFTAVTLVCLLGSSSCIQTQDEDGIGVYRERRAGEGPDSFLQNDEGLMKRPQRFSFGLGKREPDLLDDLAAEVEQQDNWHAPQQKREPYAFGLGKREPYAFGLGKRSPYQFGLGKREPYAFGLGKRADYYGFGLGKRAGYYGFGLGKREPYAFGLGKK